MIVFPKEKRKTYKFNPINFMDKTKIKVRREFEVEGGKETLELILTKGIMSISLTPEEARQLVVDINFTLKEGIENNA